MKRKIKISFLCAAVVYCVCVLIAKIFNLETHNSIFSSISLFLIAVPIEFGLYFTSVYLRELKKNTLVAVYLLMCLIGVATVLSCIVLPIVLSWR